MQFTKPVLFVLCTCALRAEVVPAGIFQDHMVLQRGKPDPVWGTAQPGEGVTVHFAGKTQRATADPQGRWMVRLAPMKTRSKPSDLRIGKRVFTDVLVGDIWLAAGQSNMEMGIGVCDVANDIAQADFPDVRLFTVPRDFANQLRDRFAGPAPWKRCSPQTLTEGGWGGFSAAGFFFARTLHQTLKVPIGIVNMSWGGTAAESWTSLEALQTLPALAPAVAKSLARIKSAIDNAADDATKREAWWSAKDPGSTCSANWANPGLDDSAWKTMPVPSESASVRLCNFGGIVWFRRDFELPSAWAGKDLILSLGPINGGDTTFVNGIKVGESFQRFLDRYYRVPAAALKPGQNTLAVRVLDNGYLGGLGGIYGLPQQLNLAPAGDASIEPISLAGEWRCKDGARLSAIQPLPPGLPQEPDEVAWLYNGMVAPLTPFALRGCIWYQGESNASRAAQYRDLLAAMIQDWRARFAQPGLPFLIVQLANYTEPVREPGESDWAELREAQALVAETLPNSGLAVAIDSGDAKNIHPKNKKEVGRRLALVALSRVYGKKVEYSGPLYQSMSIEGSAIRLKFSHVGGGLIAKGGPLQQFAIAGPDKQFVWADARIEKDTVVVSSPHVPSPMAVRYAWATNPEGCNLYNKAGLPAPPFRTAIK